MLYMQVVRAAEEAASTLAGSIHPEQCIKVLCPIVQTADYPINLAAIKMQSKVVERITKEALHQLLPDIIPGLLQVSIAHVLHFMIKKFISLLLSLWNYFQLDIRFTEISLNVWASSCIHCIYSRTQCTRMENETRDGESFSVTTFCSPFVNLTFVNPTGQNWVSIKYFRIDCIGNFGSIVNVQHFCTLCVCERC